FLKRVKRDPGWKQNAQRCDRRLVESERLQRCGERVHEEVQVLENPQESKVDDERHDQQRSTPCAFARPGDGSGTIEIHDRRRRNQAEEARIPPTVEDVARDQQQNILLMALQTPVCDRDKREKEDVDWSVE